MIIGNIRQKGEYVLKIFIFLYKFIAATPQISAIGFFIKIRLGKIPMPFPDII